jgi:hypothetical protein
MEDILCNLVLLCMEVDSYAQRTKQFSSDIADQIVEAVASGGHSEDIFIEDWTERIIYAASQNDNQDPKELAEKIAIAIKETNEEFNDNASFKNAVVDAKFVSLS